MARVRPLEPRRQSINESGYRAGTNTANQIKAENLKGFNEAFQEITDPIAAGMLASEAQADRMAKFEIEQNLPIEQIPEAEGGFNPLSLTKWGRAYDASYNEIDKQLISFKAQQALNASALELGRPENQGPGITASYGEQSRQIIDAYVNNASPANRNELMLSLSQKAATNEFALAETESEYNRIQLTSQLNEARKSQEEELYDAARMDDEVRIIKATKSLQDLTYSEMNQNIISKAEGEARLQDIASKGRESLVVGKYIRSEYEGKGAEFLATLVSDPMAHNLTLAESEGAAKQIMQLRNFQETAKADARANSYAQISFGIDNGTITTEEQIMNAPYIDLPQKLSEITRMNRLQAKHDGDSKKRLDALSNIMSGHQGLVTPETKGTLFDDSLTRNKEIFGDDLTLDKIGNSILGIGDSYPVTGVLGLSLGSNVAAFDRLMTTSLTSGDPEQMSRAAVTYNWMVNTHKQPNTVNIEGEAKLVAINTSSLMSMGMNPERAAEIAKTNILDVDDTRRDERFNTFKTSKITNRLEAAYTETFGVAPSNTDGSYTHFTNIMRSYYGKSGDFDLAKQAAANDMRNVGSSEYFLPGRVLPYVPEKELYITQIGHVFENQKAWAVQGAINANMEQRKSEGKNSRSDKIEWADPLHTIDLTNKTPEQMVMIPFLTKNVKGAPGIDKDIPVKPRIKITPFKGEPYESDIYLDVSTRTALGGQSRPIYDLMYLDPLGHPQYLSAAKYQATGGATFSPADLKDWSPEIFEERYNKTLTEGFNAVRNAPVYNLIRNQAAEFFSFTGNVKPGKEFVDEFIQLMVERGTLPENNAQLHEELKKLYSEDGQ